MKTVLLVITKSNWGGAQRHVYDVATSLHHHKLAKVVVAMGGQGLLGSKLRAEGIAVEEIPSLGRNMHIGNEISAFMHLFDIVKRVKPDIMHLHSPKAAGLGAVIGRVMGIPTIIQTVHGWSFNEQRPLWQRAIIAFFSWITTLLCHTTITIAEHERMQGLMMPFVHKKIKLIHIALNPFRTKTRREARAWLHTFIPPHVQLPEKVFIIGTIGELHPNKGYTYALEAMALLKHHADIRYAVIGTGELYQQLVQQAEKLGIADRVFWLGFVENAAQYLKAFDLFLLASQKEGLPFVLLEAGIAGLPVITTGVGGVGDIVEDMSSGIVIQPGRPKEIASAIEFMMTHPTLRRDYTKKLSDRVHEFFTLDTMMPALIELYGLHTHTHTHTHTHAAHHTAATTPTTPPPAAPSTIVVPPPPHLKPSVPEITEPATDATPSPASTPDQ
jgi:glycosyltransferase involved in cell wall biosynthesis